MERILWQKNSLDVAGYYISDPITLFYFKYIFRNLSRLNVMDCDVFFDKFIANDFEEKYVLIVFYCCADDDSPKICIKADFDSPKICKKSVFDSPEICIFACVHLKKLRCSGFLLGFHYCE